MNKSQTLNEYDTEEVDKTVVKKRRMNQSAKSSIIKPSRKRANKQMYRTPKLSKQQLEQDRIEYEKWCKEYEEIKNYPLIVETVERDY
jgi:hypothetical protein